MDKGNKKSDLRDLPNNAAEFIKNVIQKMRYRKKVRQDVHAELTAHFEDELQDCKTDEEREQKARQIITGFGDVKLLAILLRRAKKRCRPLWRKALVRSFQAVGIVILYILICSAPLVIGRANVSVNYIDWLNEQVRAGRAESQNAYPYYKQAVESSVKISDWLKCTCNLVKWPADFNNVEMQALLKFLEDNKEAFALVREGVEKPYYWATYQARQPDLMKSDMMVNVMKLLPDFRQLAYAFTWRILYKEYKVDVDGALNDCLVLQKFGSHLQGNGLLIEQLLGIAIEARSHRTMFMILEKTDVPVNTLKDIQERLHDEFGRDHDIINLEGEKAFLYDYIQRSFTDDGRGGGRMLVKGVPLAVGDWKSGLWRFVTLSYPDRREVTAKVDQYYRVAEQAFDETPWHAGQEDESEKYMKIAGDSFLLRITAPAHGRIVQLEWRVKTIRLGLLTVLALERYEKDKGEYPENLSTLVELGYLKEIPDDPYSDGPLVYKKTDKDFILYSFGENLIDDGGQVARRDDGSVKQWASEGDWVFRPVSELQVTQ